MVVSPNLEPTDSWYVWISHPTSDFYRHVSKQVTRENSRFHALMASQLEAAAGESAIWAAATQAPESQKTRMFSDEKN